MPVKSRIMGIVKFYNLIMDIGIRFAFCGGLQSVVALACKILKSHRLDFLRGVQGRQR